MRDPEPGTTPCACGLSAKRVISRSVTILGVGSTGKHRTIDSVERSQGAGHVDMLIEQRETTEWLTAIGAGDGHTGDGKSSCLLPTGDGVRDKQAQIKRGVKPPESATFGLKAEFVAGIGR